MSQLWIITRPALVAGFQLAGIDAYGVEDMETAQELIASWLEAREAGLLAIDDGLLGHVDPTLIKSMEDSEQLHFLEIPGGRSLGSEFSRKHRISEMIRRAIGFHITFKGEEGEVED